MKNKIKGYMGHPIKDSGFIWRMKHYGNIQEDGFLVGHKLTEWNLCAPLTKWFLDNTTIESDWDDRLVDFDLEDFREWLKEALKQPDSYSHDDFKKMLKVQHDIELAHGSFAHHYLFRYCYEQY